MSCGTQTPHVRQEEGASLGPSSVETFALGRAWDPAIRTAEAEKTHEDSRRSP